MPELPEVRTLAERLDRALSNLQVESLDMLGFSALKTVSPPPGALVGRRLEGVKSRAKYLCFSFEGEQRLLVHLGNSGRLDLERPPKGTKPRGSALRLDLGEAAILVREFGRERRVAAWILENPNEGPLATLGPEPGEEACAALIRTSRDSRHLHTVLRDQHCVSGIGRGYADDALQRAGLSPFATLRRLDEAGRERLLASILSVINEALVHERQREGGLSDASLGDRFAIHRRAGQPCPSCARTLERVSYDSHEIVYCPACQTDGRVLADRRLSRLLR